MEDSLFGKPARNFAPRTIWTGDNLDILRGINSETVDLIYLDPPFNSNRTYSAPIGSKAAGAAFEDTWTLDKEDVAWMGLIADQHPAIHSVVTAAGDAHSTGMQSYLISSKAVELVHMRLRDTLGELYHAGMVTARSDIPQRTDIEAPINYRQNRHVLFGEQEGKCNGFIAPAKLGIPFDRHVKDLATGSA